MQLPSSNHCGVFTVALSAIMDWCGERERDCFCAHQENNSCIHWPPRKLRCLATVHGIFPWQLLLMSHQTSRRGMALFWPLFSLAGVTSFAQVPSSSLYIHCLQKTFRKPKQLWQTPLGQSSPGKTIQHQLQGRGFLFQEWFQLQKSPNEDMDYLIPWLAWNEYIKYPEICILI